MASHPTLPHRSAAEGDTNGTPERDAWQRDTLDDAARRELDRDSRHFLHQSMSTPCLNVLKGAEGIHLIDAQDRRIMDFHGNSVHQIGYGHPHVIAAVTRQMQTLPFLPRRFAHPLVTDLAEKLTALAPGDLNKVLFAPGGTSAIGMALKLARKATGRFKTVSMWDSFHGASLDAISVGGEGVFRGGIGPLLPGTSHVMPYDGYRPMFDDPLKCLDYLDYVMERETDVGAVVLETIRATEVHVPPVEYHQRLRSICDKHGALLILDEIPTALGRTGRMFAVEHYGIVPDMLVIGKGLGGALFPMAALIAREGLDVAGDVSLGHYTHEKSILGAAAALATLEVIGNEGLLEHARMLGEHLRARLGGMRQRYELVGDVRSIGLIGAIELVTDRTTKDRASAAAERILYRCLSDGLSFKVSQGNILTLGPPLIITRDQLDEALDIIERAIAMESA
ncbi:aspartate aminotransferase family protein [Luteolibacter ambystomatis]|uniref:Aspartate aminotransferase family protein n=1 Tax=Luteolibacter ambystomatis TaxID=2824561 RepID=A0A975J0C1_9BACT|nr:aspartate aminotransferase family protein [Luteolibacter ambystomatis]QUE51675.1 aspartate aminotransferase family protein [Luteolibacter ambystomatis]